MINFLSSLLLLQLLGICKGYSSDQFDDQAFFDSSWVQEGAIDSALVSGGVLTLSPREDRTFGWYGGSTNNAILISQTIEAGTNFVIETSLSVSSSTGGSPEGNWHSAGLLIRSMSNIDTYAHINLGRQGSAFGLPMMLGTQAMLTVNSQSSFRYEESSLPLSGRLRICRVGSEISLLRFLDSDTSGWHAVEYDANGVGVPSFDASTDLLSDVQVGMMMSRWENSINNVQADFQYVQFAEPNNLSDCLIDDLSSVSGPATDEPTSPSTPIPTQLPTPMPTESPIQPTSAPPTPSPTTGLSPPPTPLPTEGPTAIPTEGPTAIPTGGPTISPATPAPNSVPIENLSDEFFSATTFDLWQDLYPTQHDSATVSDGIFTVVPSGPTNGNVWYDNSHGSGFTKLLTGNFLVETLVNVRVGNDGEPNGDWNVGGLVAQSVNEANNWIVVNIGLQGASERMGLLRTLGVESKTTSDGFSVFNYSPDLRDNLPQSSQAVVTARLRICRVGSDFLMLHMVEGSSFWVVQNPLPAHEPWNGVDGVPTFRPDMPETLNVGVMTNHMRNLPGNDDQPTVSRFDYVRYGSVISLQECTGAMSFM